MEIPTQIYNKYRGSWQEGEPQLARDVGNEFDEAFEDDLASEQTDFWRLKKHAEYLEVSCSTPIGPMQVTAQTHMANSGTMCLNSSPKTLYQSWFPYCRIFLNKEQMSWRNIVQLEIQPIRSTIYNHGIHCCTRTCLNIHLPTLCISLESIWELSVLSHCRACHIL